MTLTAAEAPAPGRSLAPVTSAYSASARRWSAVRSSSPFAASASEWRRALIAAACSAGSSAQSSLMPLSAAVMMTRRSSRAAACLASKVRVSAAADARRTDWPIARASASRPAKHLLLDLAGGLGRQVGGRLNKPFGVAAGDPGVPHRIARGWEAVDDLGGDIEFVARSHRRNAQHAGDVLAYPLFGRGGGLARIGERIGSPRSRRAHWSPSHPARRATGGSRQAPRDGATGSPASSRYREPYVRL